MDIQTLTSFFMWWTIVDFAVLGWAMLWFVVAPDFVYRMQSRFFPLPRETFNAVVYGFLGAFKLLIIVFNIAPLVALMIVG